MLKKRERLTGCGHTNATIKICWLELLEWGDAPVLWNECDWVGWRRVLVKRSRPWALLTTAQSRPGAGLSGHTGPAHHCVEIHCQCYLSAELFLINFHQINNIPRWICESQLRAGQPDVKWAADIWRLCCSEWLFDEKSQHESAGFSAHSVGPHSRRQEGCLLCLFWGKMGCGDA